MNYFIIIGFVVIIFSITLYIRYNAKPHGLPKKDIFLALIAITIIISSIVYQFFNPPLPNVSYAFIQSKKETITHLMSETTKDTPEPIDITEYAKQVGLSSLDYRYGDTAYNTMNTIEKNIEASPKWVEVPTTTQSDSKIKRSFCHGEFSLNLYRNTINISWDRHNYCWRREHGEVK